jgi:hypothetical protein
MVIIVSKAIRPSVNERYLYYWKQIYYFYLLKHDNER